MIPNISAVEHNVVVNEKKAQLIDIFDLFDKPIDNLSSKVRKWQPR